VDEYFAVSLNFFKIVESPLTIQYYETAYVKGVSNCTPALD